jgi:Zn-dependent protease with chaperone function
MTFAQRFALVLLAAFFLSSVATSLLAYLTAPLVVRARPAGSAARRAGALALFRLLPAAAAVAITLFVLGPGYFEHEQRGELEGASYALLLLAAGGTFLLLESAARIARALRPTSALRRSWIAQGERLDMPAAGMPAFALDLAFPLVAVLGVLRPRLFISRAVLRGCTGAEFAAILEHERAHVRGGDNIVRLLMEASPDLLASTRLQPVIADAWHAAVEHRADDAAARKLDLASALVKVARLASSAPPMPLPASALYHGEGRDVIGERVRRLVAAPARDARPRWVAVIACSAATIGALVATAALTGAASRLAHNVLEIAVSKLP